MDSDEENSKEKRKHIVIKNSTDLQRMKLEKLMKNPDKPVIIPERPKQRGVPVVPDFVRNVMGSSAGAGSGEFHVYRHLRRKEYARQKYMQEKGERERLDEEYHKKLEEHRLLAEAKTAKKRAKRLKKKQKCKGKKKKPKLENDSSDYESDSASEEECTDGDKVQSIVNENNEHTEKKEIIDENNISNQQSIECENIVESSESGNHKQFNDENKVDEEKEVIIAVNDSSTICISKPVSADNIEIENNIERCINENHHKLIEENEDVVKKEGFDIQNVPTVGNAEETLSEDQNNKIAE